MIKLRASVRTVDNGIIIKIIINDTEEIYEENLCQDE